MAKKDAIDGLALNGWNAVSATWRSVPAEMASAAAFRKLSDRAAGIIVG